MLWFCAQVSEMCCDAVSKLLKQDKLGQASLAVVKVISGMIKSRSYNVKPQVQHHTVNDEPNRQTKHSLQRVIDRLPFKTFLSIKEHGQILTPFYLLIWSLLVVVVVVFFFIGFYYIVKYIFHIKMICYRVLINNFIINILYVFIIISHFYFVMLYLISVKPMKTFVFCLYFINFYHFYLIHFLGIYFK